MKSLGLALAKVETRQEQHTQLLEQILKELQKRPATEPTTSTYNFSAIKDVLPVSSLDEFDELEHKISTDEHFKVLFVSTVRIVLSHVMLLK